MTDKQNDCYAHNKEIVERLSQGNKQFAIHNKDIEHLKEWQKRQNGSLGEIADCMKEIKDDVQEIKLENAQGKPSWAVALIMGALLSAITGLIVHSL